MANRGAPSKNVIYDSTTDTSSGRKRAVDFTGGVSVAERARLFGAQVNHTPVSKPTKSDNENHQRIRTNSANQNYSYSSTQRPPNNSRSAPPQNYDRPNRNDQPPPSSINSHDYSTVNRSHKQQQQPKATYQSVIYSTPQKSKHTKPSYTSVTPGESYTTDDEIYYESQRRRRRQQQQQQQQHQQAPPAYNSNYFQPIRDPLEVLYTQPSFGYSQPSLTNNDNMQPFDLSNLIGRIQQDYVNNARPYVSSIQFIENPQIPSTGNRTTNDLYLRPGASYQYDVIDTSKLLSTYMRPVPTQNQHRRSHHHHHHHSSSRRRQNRGHYRDCASSPIDIVEKQKTPSPPPKPPTPIEEQPETSEETDEEETVNTKTEEKTAEDETSEEEEDEEEEKKPAIAVPPTIATRPPLATVPPVTQNESSSSESEESESDSDSDSDDSDDSDKGKSKHKKKGKPPIVPAPAPARINARTTPQLNSRGATQPATPTMKVVTNKTDDPPEVSSSVKSFNTQELTKSPGIRGKFSSLASKFRRKKS